jgi:hypothetical protein
MTHNHVNEYQIKTAHEDGTEELTLWMDSEEQLAQAMAAVHKIPGKAYWLRVRSVLCSECIDTEQQIVMESPITDIPSPRYCAHNSNYLLALGSRNRGEIFDGVSGIRR